MKVFLLCFLFVGANAADLLDSLHHGLANIEEELASTVSAILKPLLGDEWANYLGPLVVKVAERAAIRFIWKRDVPHNVTIKDVLMGIEQMFDDYATEVQHFHEEIVSRAYLKGDVNQFFADMQHSKLRHDKKLANIISSVKQTLTCGKRKRKDIDNSILSRACVQFSSAANKLNETFSDVHSRLILAAVNDHLSLLNDTLSH